MPVSIGPGPGNPDMRGQQRKDPHRSGKSQADAAKDREKPTVEERIERDARANEGIGEALSSDHLSIETEEALKRAVDRSRRE